MSNLKEKSESERDGTTDQDSNGGSTHRVTPSFPRAGPEASGAARPSLRWERQRDTGLASVQRIHCRGATRAAATDEGKAEERVTIPTPLPPPARPY
jgi:hypothetical protein